MRPLLPALASLIVAFSASAAVMFNPTQLQLTVGQNADVQVSFVSIGTTGGVLRFDSCDPAIATVTGEVVIPQGTHGASGSFHVIARRPGATSACLYGLMVVPITVTCGPVLPAEPAQPRLTTPVGTPVTLSVISPLLPDTTYTWYRGRAGDMTAPLSGDRADLVFTPVVSGANYVWVSVVTPCSTSHVEFLVQATARRRAVRK